MQATLVQDIRKQVVGIDTLVPLIDGSFVPYINFDNAASTPVLQPVQDVVNEFLVWYSSVHRGSGYKSRVSTKAYDDARKVIADFVGANLDEHVVIFTKHATEALNKISRRLGFGPEDVVLTSMMEHHSNDLPWRLQAKVIHIDVTPTGELDEDDFNNKIAKYSGNVRLVAITGASNVTGIVNPINKLAEKAHAVGALILVDMAQLAPHRPIKMLSLDDPHHLDYIVLSAHKMYAPFGSGALIGRRDLLEEGNPVEVGGGTVDVVTKHDVEWTHLPDKDEAGSPNVVGAVAFATAAQVLQSIGMDLLAAHERQLTSYALERLGCIEGLTLYGPKVMTNGFDRVGVISFNVNEIQHGKVAAILSWEAGIGVRNGCFCAHPYVIHLLKLSEEDWRRYRVDILSGNKSQAPGLVRVSFGFYNTTKEVDILVNQIEKIVNGQYRGNYYQENSSGDYIPERYDRLLEQAFSIRRDFG